MTTKLEIFKAELEALEAADGYGEAHYDYLVEQVERLEREEASKPAASAPASATAPDADPFQALQTEMQAALANPGRFTDAQIDELVTRFNAAVIAAGTTSTERVDIGQLQRDMATATSNPGALSDSEHTELLRRYNAAARQGPERRTSEALRGELASGDLPARMRAAEALQQRGLLEDGVADALVMEYQASCQAAAERGLDVAALPPELQEAAKAILAAQAALEVPADPTEAALHQLDQAIRSMKSPTLAEQLEALGVQAEPEPESVSTSQET
jgi:hypothetical protein